MKTLRQTTLRLAAKGPGLHEITHPVSDWSARQGPESGLLTLFLPHTWASLIVQENADPDIIPDLQDFFRRPAPESEGYRHGQEGPDDMPAHIRAALTQCHPAIPIIDGRLGLGN